MPTPKIDAKKNSAFNLTLNNLAGEKCMDIPGCFDRYMISNYGRVRSLPRIVDRPSKGAFFLKERILKPSILKRNPLIGTNEPALVLQQSVIDNSKKSIHFSLDG